MPATIHSAILALAWLAGVHAGLYTKLSPVLQVNADTYDQLIAQSNHTSVVEFYAPWCGHCQSLKPTYEKVARNLYGLANVAAVNCDDEANKALCSTFGVKGFPTIKIVRPYKARKPAVEDYEGKRTAGPIVDAVLERINNHVVRVDDQSVDDFLKKANESAKVLLFTEKGYTPPLVRAIAIDFLDVIKFGQVRNTQKKVREMFGIEKLPTIMLLPGGDADAIVYDGAIRKADIVKFLSQAGLPNPDPAPTSEKAKDTKEKPLTYEERMERRRVEVEKAKKKKAEKEKAEKKKAEKKKAEEKEKEELKKRADEADMADKPTSEPEPAAQDAVVESVPPIPNLHDSNELESSCLNDKSHTCVLAFASPGDKATQALGSLAELAHKYARGQRHLFPMFDVSRDAAGTLLSTLGLDGEVEVVAINARRGWWRRYEGTDFGHEAIERWVDAIRLGEGVKKKLPDGVVVAAKAAEPKGKPQADEATSTEEASAQGAPPETDKTESMADKHDEL